MNTYLQNVTLLSQGPLAAADPCVSVYGRQQHFGYRDSDGIVWDSWYDGEGNWNLQQINGAGGKTNGPAAIAGPFIGVFQDQQHFAYVDKDGVIWDSWYDGNGHWNLQSINSKFVGEPQGPPAVIYDWLSISIWTDPSNTQQHFTYFGQDAAVHDTFWDSNPPLAEPHWNRQTFAPGGGWEVSSSPFACVFKQQQHIGFLANFGDFFDYWYDGDYPDRWTLQAIAGATHPKTNGPQAFLGIPPYIWVDYTNTQQHFTYLGADRAIYDAFWDSDGQSWSLQKLTLGGLTDGPEAWSRPTVCNFQPAGFINRVYIAYRDVLGMVWIITYANDQWLLVKLKDLPFGVTTDFAGDVPSASGNVASWADASGTQVHFTFRHIERAVIVPPMPPIALESRGFPPKSVQPNATHANLIAANYARENGVIWDLFYDQPPYRG
jgi:hypothetical protein